ncbi:MFS transporter [Egicoccus halophilus]|nr:MFS transporter [Egicoccus halophilus]
MSGSARLLAYAIGAFGLGIGNSMVFLMPLRARELGASFEFIGLLVAAASILPVLLAVPLGEVVDRFGPRRGFLLGAGTSAIVAALAALVVNHWVLLVLQLAFGATRGLGWIASQSYVTGMATGTARAANTGRFSLFSNAGTMIAPLLTGVVAQFVGFRWAFLFIAAYAGVFFVLGLGLKWSGRVSISAKRRRRDVGFRRALGLVAVPGVQAALFLTGARLWLAKTFTGFFPVLIVEAGVDPAVAGSVIAMSGLVATMMAPTAGFWCRFARPATVCASALGCAAVGIAFGPQLVQPPLVYLPAAMFGIGSGLSLPLLLTIVTNSASESQRGLVLGLRQTVNNVAGSTAPIVVGPLVAGVGMVLAFPLSAAVAAAAIAVAAVRGRTGPSPDASAAR